MKTRQAMADKCAGAIARNDVAAAVGRSLHSRRNHSAPLSPICNTGSRGYAKQPSPQHVHLNVNLKSRSSLPDDSALLVDQEAILIGSCGPTCADWRADELISADGSRHRGRAAAKQTVATSAVGQRPIFADARFVPYGASAAGARQIRCHGTKTAQSRAAIRVHFKA